MVYALYLLGAFVSIILYKENRVAGKIGFSIAAVASAIGVFHFLLSIGSNETLEIGGNFLFHPHFALDPLGKFFSFVISLISVTSIPASFNTLQVPPVLTISYPRFFNSFAKSTIPVLSLTLKSALIVFLLIFFEIITYLS